jgi:hypothetical protein
VRTITPQGEQRIYWGKGLPRALEEAEAKVGESIVNLKVAHFAPPESLDKSLQYQTRQEGGILRLAVSDSYEPTIVRHCKHGCRFLIHN